MVTAVSTLFKFLLDSLQQCDRQYTLVFKVLSGFCGGRSVLTASDRGYLLDQLKKSQVDAEVAQLEGVCECGICQCIVHIHCCYYHPDKDQFPYLCVCGCGAISQYMSIS